MDNKAERFYHLTQTISKNVKELHPDAFHVIMGDFNANFAKTDEQEHMVKVRLLKKKLLEDSDCRLDRKELGITRFRSKQESEIDHIITNIALSPEEYGKRKMLYDNKPISDHYLIFVDANPGLNKIVKNEKVDSKKSDYKNNDGVDWTSDKKQFNCHRCGSSMKCCESNYHMIIEHDILDLKLWLANDKKIIDVTIVAKYENILIGAKCENILIGFTEDFGHHRLFQLKDHDGVGLP